MGRSAAARPATQATSAPCATPRTTTARTGWRRACSRRSATSKTDVAIFREMGELGLLGPTIPEHYGGAGAQLRQLRPGRARGRARRLGLPLDDERAVLARHGADQRVRHRGAEAEVPAQARHRRMDRLLRPHRAEPRLRPRQHGHAREEGRGRLFAQRHQDVDHQLADRRRVRRLGEGRRRCDPRLHSRQGLQGPVGAGDPRQGRPARHHHRRDRDGRGVLPRRERLSRRARPEGPVHLPRTRRATASPGARWARPRTAGTARASTRSTASSSASRWRPTSWFRRSSPTCRPRSRSACRAACASAA